MNILLLALLLVALATVLLLYLKWTRSDQDAKNNDAEHYTSLLNLYAQDCARHLDAAQNPERSWKDRMDRLNQAEEAKQKHASTLGEAPTDMRGQDLDHPPSADVRSLRQELFDARKGDPSLPWSVLRAHEKVTHAQELERAVAQLRTYGEEQHAEEVEALAEEIYRDLVNRESRRSTPYLQLAIMYRRQNDIDLEAKVLEKGLEQINFDSDAKRQKLQDRLKQIHQLQGRSESNAL